MNTDELNQLVPELFAPWVQALQLQAVELLEDGVVFTLPVTEQLLRAGGKGGGVMCGQALAAAADTTSVLVLCHANERFRACTTTDLNIRFMRPLSAENPVELQVRVASNGRRMAVTRVDVKALGAGRLAAVASCSFMYLED